MRKVNLKLGKRGVDLAPIRRVHLQQKGREEESTTFDPLSETESGVCVKKRGLLTLLFQGFKNSIGGRTKSLSPRPYHPHLLLLLIHPSTVTVLTLLLFGQIFYFQFNANTFYIFLIIYSLNQFYLRNQSKLLIL